MWLFFLLKPRGLFHLTPLDKYRASVTGRHIIWRVAIAKTFENLSFLEDLAFFRDTYE